MWIIKCAKNDPNTNEDLFWSNEWGWVTSETPDITLFNDAQKRRINLPIEGEWRLASEYEHFKIKGKK